MSCKRKSTLKFPLMMKTFGAAFFILFLGAAVVEAQEAKPVYKVHVDGLSCPFCAYGIEKKFSQVEGVETIEIDIKTGTTLITMAPGKILNETAARKAVEAAGFNLRDFEKVPEIPKNKE